MGIMAEDDFKTFEDRMDNNPPAKGHVGNNTQDTMLDEWGDITPGDEYAKEFMILLEMINKELPSLHAKHENNSAAVIPRYENRSDVPDEELAQEAGSNGDALVIVDEDDGPVLHKCTE